MSKHGLYPVTILYMENPEEKKEIIAIIKLLENNNNSAAVRNRVSNALNILKNDAPLPKAV